MMTPREAAASTQTATHERHRQCPRRKPEMLPWNAARYFYSMADWVMLV
jgi:hypothetical protein